MRRVSGCLYSMILSGAVSFGLVGSAAADDHEVQRHAVRFDGRGLDAATGSDPRNYPPDPQVDFLHLKLDIACEDPASESFVATETLTFQTLERGVARLGLDAVKLDIREVTDLGGNKLKYNADGSRLTIEFGHDLPPRTAGGVIITYEAHGPEGTGGGLHFSVPAEGAPRGFMAHSQGEAEWNRFWFVSHDYPNEKLTSEISIVLPGKYKALANGKLVEHKEFEDGRVLWHYRMDQPHSTYLISLVFGDFAVVRDEWKGIPVEYWVPPDREKDARPSLGRTPEMIDWFSKRTGVDYPYPKYAQALVYEFNWGGMENISATTLVETALLDERARLDQDDEGLVSHELAHQWFGDLVTCRSWPHIWLNEGFASYMEYVWYEHAKGLDDYYYSAWNNMAGVAQNPEDDATVGVVFSNYSNPDEVFFRGNSNPYSKGASNIHMLHELLGDELFWKVIHEYLTRFSFRNAETDDLRKVAEELSGRSLERFFQQWFYRPGSPAITLDYKWDADKSSALVTVTQTQKLTADRPAFRFELPIWFVLPDGQVNRQTVSVENKTAQLTLALPTAPVQVVVDPTSSVLARYVLNIPDLMLIEQARNGPTVISRCAAVRWLGTRGDEGAVAVLEEILNNEQTHEELRKEAAGALGRRNSAAARDILIGALAENRAIPNAHVKRAAIDALAGYKAAESVPTLLRFARHDRSVNIESAATAALGRQTRTDEIVAVLLENTHKDSGGEAIRLAALGALVDLGEQGGLEVALSLAQATQLQYIRNAAAGILGRMGKTDDDRKRICEHFLATLNLLNTRAQPPIIGALGALGDEAAVEPLQRIADGAAEGPVRSAAQGAIAAIHDKASRQTELKSLQAKVSELEERVRSLAQRTAD